MLDTKINAVGILILGIPTAFLHLGDDFLTKEMKNRKNIRCKNYMYNSTGHYFITICANNHSCIFGTVNENEVILSELGRIVEDCIKDVSNHYRNVMIEEYIIMPNHIHFILHVREDTEIAHIGNVINLFKGAVSRHSHMNSIWQRNYYEHIIRTEKEYDEILKYIANNPLRWYFDKENPDNW